MRVRRVVTGHDADGKAVIASDEAVDGIRPALLPGAEFHRLWGGDATSQFPDSGEQPDHSTYFPPVGGFRFGLFSVPPGGARRGERIDDLEGARAELEAAFPGLAGHIWSPTRPACTRRRPSTSRWCSTVRSGSSSTTGVEVHLRPGDTVVQNGTRHAWRNHGDTTARLAVFIVGAHHERVG